MKTASGASPESSRTSCAIPRAPCSISNAPRKESSPGGARVPAHQLAADHDPRADPLAREHADDVVEPARGAAPALGDHRQVAVVLDHALGRPSVRASAPARSKSSSKTLENSTRPRGVSIAPVQPTHAAANRSRVEPASASVAPLARRMTGSRSSPANSRTRSATTSPRRSATAVRTLTSPMSTPNDVAGVGAERERARRTAARALLGRDLLDPAQPDQVVGHRVDRRPRQAGRRHQLGDPLRPAGAQRVEHALGVDAAQQARGGGSALSNKALFHKDSCEKP